MVRVRPGAAHDGVGGERDGALLVSVRPPAVDGRATEAALRVIAEAFSVRPRVVRLVTGVTSRTKVVEIDGDPRVLGARLTQLRAGGGSAADQGR
jgi:uncharacterized protein YggU (UPF0235/DUF167 family)